MVRIWELDQIADLTISVSVTFSFLKQQSLSTFSVVKKEKNKTQEKPRCDVHPNWTVFLSGKIDF